MIKSKRTLEREQVRVLTVKKLKQIGADCMSRLKAQGAGGVDGNGDIQYYSSDTKNRCAIGLLLSRQMLVANRNIYSVIASESARPYVRSIAKAYSIDVSVANQYDVLVQFLTGLQDSHDELFDRFCHTSKSFDVKCVLFADSVNVLIQNLENSK